MIVFKCDRCGVIVDKKERLFKIYKGLIFTQQVDDMIGEVCGKCLNEVCDFVRQQGKT